MKRLGIIILVLVTQTILAQQSTASLEGVVLKKDTTEALAKVSVELRSQDSTVATTITDSTGRFYFPNTAPGSYSIVASRAGYIRSEYGQRRVGGPGLKVTLAIGQRVNGIQIPMTAGGVISGRLLDRGKPVGLAEVFALKLSYELGQRVFRVVQAAGTNELGEYKLFWLNPGSYYVATNILDGPGPGTFVNLNGDTPTARYCSVIPTCYQVDQRFVFSRATGTGMSDTEMHVPIYFPNSPNWENAVPVDVGPGAEVRNVNIDSNPVPALHVRGTVDGELTSAQRGNVTIALISQAELFRPGNTRSLNGSATTDSTGSFDIKVSPGNYSLFASVGNFRATKTVDVRDHDVNGVSVRLSASLTVRGKITIENWPQEQTAKVISSLRISLETDPVLSALVAARSEPPIVQLPANVMYSDIRGVSPDGSFTIPGFPTLGLTVGNYRVIVAPLLQPASYWSSLVVPALKGPVPPALQNMYVKSIRMGEEDILNGGLHLNENSREPMDIVIGTDAGSLQGRVINGNQPAAAATVALIPENGTRFHVLHSYTSTDAGGNFQFRGIAPGDYKLFAWDEIETGAWQDPDVIRRYEASGKRVTIPEGGQVSVETTSIRN